MPIQRIALRRGKTSDYKRDITRSVQDALVACFGVAPKDLFAIIDEYDEDMMIFPQGYRDFQYSENMILIWIFCSLGRSAEIKSALYAAIVVSLGTSPGIRADDVTINIVETPDENWSLGGGMPL
ncbi:MAG: 4-oxalocrotonate tautomerase [Sphingomonadales bacterium]|nr:4-oxalocrotonate tautomerase [Sphingomonadales bacterium]